MLARDLLQVLRGSGEDVIGMPHARLDITSRAAVDRCFALYQPRIVVNCAAWTDVEGAERNEAEALRLNGTAVEIVTAACAKAGAHLVHVSTDYVFDGQASEPYPEDAIACPVNAYGRTKLVGERAVVKVLPESATIVRTAWLFGENGRNFATTMLELERRCRVVDVVDDLWGQPTWTMDVARQIYRLGKAHASGIYHVTSSGAATWNCFAREIFRYVGADPTRVRAVSAARYPSVVRRPRYTVLGDNSWLPPMPHWTAAVHAYLTSRTVR